MRLKNQWDGENQAGKVDLGYFEKSIYRTSGWDGNSIMILWIWDRHQLAKKKVSVCRGPIKFFSLPAVYLHSYSSKLLIGAGSDAPCCDHFLVFFFTSFVEGRLVAVDPWFCDDWKGADWLWNPVADWNFFLTEAGKMDGASLPNWILSDAAAVRG